MNKRQQEQKLGEKFCFSYHPEVSMETVAEKQRRNMYCKYTPKNNKWLKK